MSPNTSDINAPTSATQPDDTTTTDAAGIATAVPGVRQTPIEIGGRDGPEPTRFGDWELRGRCIDF